MTEKPKPKDRLNDHTEYYIHIQRKWLVLLWFIPIAIIGFFASQQLSGTQEISFTIGGQDWVNGGYVLTAYIGICIVGYAIRRKKFIAGLLWGLLAGLLAGLLWGLLGGLTNEDEKYPWEG